MSLDLKEVDIRGAVDSAVLGLQDRIAEKAVLLDVRAAPDIGSFMADERRVRQILFNLLSNAISFSPAGDVVRLAVERRDGAIVFARHRSRARAFHPRSATACSTASRATRSAPSIAARGLAFRSCVPSSSCMVVR